MHSSETRYRAVVHYTHFLPSLRRVACQYGVSKSTLQRWVKSTANPVPRRLQKQRRPARQLHKSIEACIQQTLETDPFCPISEVARRVAETCGLHRSVRTVRRMVKRAGFTYKKAFNTVSRSHAAEDVLRFCHEYTASLQSSKPDTGELISIDEAGFYIGDHPRRGYAPRGSKLRLAGSRTLRRRKLTLLLAVSPAGIRHFQILDHNCRKADFVAFVEALPVAPGSTLLMDNVAFHHSKETSDAVRAKGCRALYTLPYSPCLDPIEYTFGSLKARYRRVCPARSCDAFDYKALLTGILVAGASTLPCFRHVAATAARAEAAGGVAFSGYDGGSNPHKAWPP